jgi:hypothetical protein
MDKSQIFKWYNKAMAAARQGKLDPKRVNGALSVLQMKEERPYHTTIKTCDCPWHKIHPEAACKHMVAKMILVRASQEPKPVPAPKPEPKPQVQQPQTGPKPQTERELQLIRELWY